MLYRPGVRPASVYVPSGRDLTVCTKPVVVSTALISAFATEFPCAFVIFPRSVAVVDDCAKALPATTSASNRISQVRLNVMTTLLLEKLSSRTTPGRRERSAEFRGG